MQADSPAKLKVVVCGTTFGQVYLEALRGIEQSFELAGILAQGSQRSRACATFYGVPLYTCVENLPGNIDVACVVVRGALLGGRGTELAQKLLQRSIHVLQEHPVHHEELAECLRVARRERVQYHLNSFYPHLDPIRRFIAAGRRALANRPALYVDAACSFQVGYALLDILRSLLGTMRPWSFVVANGTSPLLRSSQDAEPAFKMLNGSLGEVPIAIRIQHQLRASDPDDNLLLLHRITLGCDAGELSLVSSHGPIVWSARPMIPREMRNSETQTLFAEKCAPRDDTCTVVFEPGEESSQHRLFHQLWPDAVRRALDGLKHAIDSGDGAFQNGQHQLMLCRMWQDITEELGPPRLMGDGLPIARLSSAELAAMHGNDFEYVRRLIHA